MVVLVIREKKNIESSCKSRVIELLYVQFKKSNIRWHCGLNLFLFY